MIYVDSLCFGNSFPIPCIAPQEEPHLPSDSTRDTVLALGQDIEEVEQHIPVPIPTPAAGGNFEDAAGQSQHGLSWVREPIARPGAPSPELEPVGDGIRRSAQETVAPQRYGHVATTETRLGSPEDIFRFALATSAVLDTPQSYADARRSLEWQKWRKTMEKEIAQMERYEVWVLVL